MIPGASFNLDGVFYLFVYFTLLFEIQLFLIYFCDGVIQNI